MTRSEVLARTQELIGYQFKDPELLHQALTHASVADSRLDSNERMEFLGDSVLALVVCEELFRRYQEYLEGELTKLKSVIVSRKTCAQISDRLGLTPLLFLGKGMSNHDDVPTSLRAAVFESVIAGIFLDGGLEAARSFILEHAADFITQSDHDQHQRNHKSLLQQHAQKYMSSTPQYTQLDEQGPDHSKCFNVCVIIGNRRFPAAWGPSKKEAEQKAAQNALAELDESYR
ncbi:MAG: ribonuclease III [Phycisphaerae bacterium]